MKEKMLQLKSFNWRLWIALCSFALIPAVYQTIKTFLISASNPNEVFNIIGQMEWFDLINETLQAFLIVPLYSVLNKILKNNQVDLQAPFLKSGSLFLACTLFFQSEFFFMEKL